MIPLNLKNKWAFISGAAQGQGKATAIRLAQEGVNIIGCDLNQNMTYPPPQKGYSFGSSKLLNATMTEIRNLGVKAIGFCCDIRHRTEVHKMIDSISAQNISIDILFNNAGICAYKDLEHLDEESVGTMFDVNINGAIWITQKVIEHMKTKKSGVVINNVSIASERGMEKLCHYAASKWALRGLTISWAQAYAKYGIRVLSVHPTGVNTPMNDSLAAMEGKSTQEIAEASAGNLLAVPWIEPEDVAEAVTFLASDRCRMVTGSAFMVDAGLLSK